MGRNNADFQDQVVIHRGLADVTPDQIDKSDLGEHWSSDPSIAEQFAKSGFTGKGVVMSGTISPEHTVISEWEERREEWQRDPKGFDADDDYSGPDPEKEVRVWQEHVKNLRVRRVK